MPTQQLTDDEALGTATLDADSKRETKCVSIILNPVSGKGDPEDRKKLISDAVAKHGYTCQFIATSEKEGAQELTKKAIEDGVDLIVVSGGDGTVAQAMSALVGSDIPLAVLPAGTGNLLSVNLGIPTTVPEAVEVALTGEPYHLDMARFGEGKYFVIMGGLGLDAEMIHDADRKEKNKFGVFAYFRAAIKNLPRQSAMVRVQLDDRAPINRRTKSLLIANMGKITGGLDAMPTASPSDGLLDVGVLAPETLGQWLLLFAYAIIGRTQDDPRLEVFQARKIEVHTRTPQFVQYDGEDGGRVQSLSIEIVPRAVRVLVPKGASVRKSLEESPAVAAQHAGGRRLIVLASVFAGVLAIAFAVRRFRK